MQKLILNQELIKNIFKINSATPNQTVTVSERLKVKVFFLYLIRRRKFK